MKKVILTIIFTIVSTQAVAETAYKMVDVQAYEIRQAIGDFYKGTADINEDKIQFHGIEGMEMDANGKVKSIDLGFNPNHGRVGSDGPDYCTVKVDVEKDNKLTVSCEAYD